MNIQKFFEGYPANIQELFTSARQLILDALPGVKEETDPMANMLVFSLQPGYIGMIFNLMPTETQVSVGFYFGANLPDPHGLLTGKGTRHRQVRISSLEQLHTPEFAELIQAAAAVARERLQNNQ